MQRAQAASEDLSLQTPENYQALRSELDEIQNEYNGILQARRVESGEVSADYNTPESHIDNRTTEDVGNRSVKAFQFDHPQLHPYYVQAAQALMEDANWSLETQSNQKGKGTVARYSEALERAANLGLSRQEIIRVCQDIITDRGQENYAAAKKVELILDQMLSEGYTPNEALGNPDQRVGPNEAYLQAKEAIPGAVTRVLQSTTCGKMHLLWMPGSDGGAASAGVGGANGRRKSPDATHRKCRCDWGGWQCCADRDQDPCRLPQRRNVAIS